MSTRPAQVFPPGEIIREELDERGWTQQDLARITGRPLAAINEIINAKRRITAKTAQELAAAFGVDAKFWLNLQTAYDLASQSLSTAAQTRAKLMEFAPVIEMQRRGWLPSTRDIGELSAALAKFFGVSSLDERPAIAAAFRQSSGDLSSAHMAWCVRALQKGRAQKVQAFTPGKSEQLRDQLRALAAHAEEVRRVPSVLAEFGIRFVIVKHLQSTKIDGATLWLDGERRRQPLIAMSLRYGRIDNFWHTLCHEVSHVVHRDAFSIDVDLGEATIGDSSDEVEERANVEAAATLISPADIESFILRKRPYFSAKAIIQFAHTKGVHPGIVVGQLRFRKAIKYTHSADMLLQIRDAIIETAVSDGWIGQS